VRTFEELERLWQASPPARGVVRLICVRRGGAVHECPDRVLITPDGGVSGDRWADEPPRDARMQVTLMNARVAELVAAGEQPLHMAGDNFLVDFELGEAALPAGTWLRIGAALLEVSSHPHAGCKKFRERFGAEAFEWVNHRPNRARRLRGVNCRAILAGEVAVGDAIAIEPASPPSL
jgi:MOSC domain-containing protein YiiM